MFVSLSNEFKMNTEEASSNWNMVNLNKCIVLILEKDCTDNCPDQRASSAQGAEQKVQGEHWLVQDTIWDAFKELEGEYI